MTTPGFFKRLLVICYDLLLLAGVLFVACLPLPLLPDTLEFSLAGKIIKGAYILLASFIFYGWFWTHGGQTLGMKVWHLYLVDKQGKFLNWQHSAIRFFATIISWGCCGLGFTWILIDRKNRAWHDYLSNSYIVYLNKQQGSSKKNYKR